MYDPWMIAIVTVLLSGAAGLLRVTTARQPLESVLAVQLLGTSLVATLLMAAHAWQMPTLITVALLVALLAAVAIAALVTVLRRQMP
jgi:multicomponent Na+:H+ antiporter subunit F